MTQAAQPKTKGKLVRSVLGITTVSLLAFGAAMWRIDAYGHRERVQPAQAIVVLGAGVLSNGKASLSLRERTQHAVELYRRNLASHIILTGGVGDYPPSEAQVAFDLAVKLGVPRDQLLMENKSTSTRENAAFAAEICHARGWKSVIVVSQPFHLWRACRDFERFGLTAYTSPVRHASIDAKPVQRIIWTAREVLVLLRDVAGL